MTYYTQREAAELVGVSNVVLWRWQRAGHFPGVKRWSRRRWFAYTEDDLTRIRLWMKQRGVVLVDELIDAGEYAEQTLEPKVKWKDGTNDTLMEPEIHQPGGEKHDEKAATPGTHELVKLTVIP